MNRTWMSLAPVLMLAGCATHYASFVTKTSLAVLDLDTTPVEASIAFGRTEGYVGPRFDDGSVYPVTGFINARGSALKRETQQVFAGGSAAVLVLKGMPKELTNTCTDGRDRPPLFLATSTSVGLRVGFVENSPLPNSFSFGYRRKEAALVPVDKNCQPSVLATHDSDAGARQATDQPKAQLAITQYFATGAAADVLARSKTVQDMFQQGAEAAKISVAAFSDRERLQLRSTIDAVGCAAALDDAQFEDVALVNARELGLFPENGYDKVMAAAKGGPRRQRYAELLQLRAGADEVRSTAMEIHRRRVCGPPKPG